MKVWNTSREIINWLWKHAPTHTNGVDDIRDAVSDGSTKGIATFTAADFDDSSGVISLDSTVVKEADVDDTPVNGATVDPISSNWAYDHKVQMIDGPLSPMLVSGGVISEGSTGTVSISEITGALLRSGTGATDPLVWKTLAAQANQSIGSANAKHYVVLTSTPAIVIRTTPIGNGTTEIGIGTCMKDASDNVHFQNAGMRLQNGVAKLHRRAASLRTTELASGCTITDEGSASRQFHLAEGVVYHGISRLTPYSGTSFDSGTNKFTYVYRDGAASWSFTADQEVINNTQYYDGAHALATLSAASHYACHWVYLHPDDEHVYVMYGTTDAKLAEAVLAQPPSDVPVEISDFSVLLGCIIIKKDATAFAVIQMVTDVFFSGTAAADHGELSGLDDDDHTQYILHSLADASGDFLVASGNDAFAKQTTAQALATLSPLTTRGDIMFRNATVSTRLAKGAENTLLVMGADDPAWSAILAGLTLTSPTISGTVDLGSGGLLLTTTGTWQKIQLKGTWEGAQGVIFEGYVLSASAATNDVLLSLRGTGRDTDTPHNVAYYGRWEIQIESPTADAEAGKQRWFNLLSGVDNMVMTLSSAGLLWTDIGFNADDYYQVAGTQVVTAQGAAVADAKADYGAGELDTEAKIITAINAANTTLNTLLARVRVHGLIAT